MRFTLAVAADGGRVGLRVFVFVALFDADARHNGLIGRGQVGGFIRFHGRVQRDFFKNIARRFAMLTDEIASLAQRLGYGDAVFIGRHAADQRISISVVFVDVEGHARNGISVFAIRLGQAQPALCRLVHRCDFVGLAALKAVDFRSERRIDIVRGHGGFLDAVSAIVEPAGFRSTLLVDGEQDGFANARAVGRRRRRQARNDELHACQRLMRQTVRLDDADSSLNRCIGKGNPGGCTGSDSNSLTALHGNLISLRCILFAHGICTRLHIGEGRRAVRAGRLGLQDSARAVQQFKDSARKCRAGTGAGFGDDDCAIRLFKLNAHGFEFRGQTVLRNDDLLNIRVRDAD